MTTKSPWQLATLLARPVRSRETRVREWTSTASQRCSCPAAGTGCQRPRRVASGHPATSTSGCRTCPRAQSPACCAQAGACRARSAASLAARRACLASGAVAAAALGRSWTWSARCPLRRRLCHPSWHEAWAEEQAHFEQYFQLMSSRAHEKRRGREGLTCRPH